MPGPGCIYLAQNLKFKVTIRAGDVVKTVCTVTKSNERRKFAKIKPQYFVGDTMIVDGSGTVLVPSRE